MEGIEVVDWNFPDVRDELIRVESERVQIATVMYWFPTSVIDS